MFADFITEAQENLSHCQRWVQLNGKNAEGSADWLALCASWERVLEQWVCLRGADEAGAVAG